MTDALHVLVDRDDIAATRIERTPTLEPAMGEILVRVNKVALTANNVTYAVVSDRIPYFEFFPAPPGWGRLPVWGFGDVVASNSPGLDPGARIYGLWPTSTHVVLQPDRVTSRSFVDGAEHRAELPSVYNSYSLVATDETYERHDEARIAIFRPLFLTAYALDRFLSESAMFGADQLIISSASAKTAWLLAHLTARRSQTETVGLTSARHRAFVESLALYDHVLTYDEIDTLEPRASVYVDVAGAANVRNDLRTTLGGELVYDCAVGLAHWTSHEPAPPWQGAPPVLFFAPMQFARMVEQRGAAAFWTDYRDAWDGALGASEGKLWVQELNGLDALADAYRDFVRGDVDPSKGVVIRF